jgi:hypothetical protein
MQCESTLLLVFDPLEEFCKFKGIHPLCVLLTIKITSLVKTRQFILLFSTTCFSLKGHQQVEYRIKRIYMLLTLYFIYVLLILYST